MHASRSGTPLRRPADSVLCFHRRFSSLTLHTQYMPHIASQLSRRFRLVPQCRLHDRASSACVRRPFLASRSESASSVDSRRVCGPLQRSCCASLLYHHTFGTHSVVAALFYARAHQRFPDLARIPFRPLDQWIDSRSFTVLYHDNNPFGRHAARRKGSVGGKFERSACRKPSAAASCPHASTFLPGHRFQLLQLRTEAVVDFKSLLIAGLD